ncbi:uncharacterized protein LOC121048564 [Ixodes scapularis]|uniref:uncharacterized protein LOC121048564 n=1 Tax=Ixodes scapularis TaxID=6945 RepID=UPI001AD7AFCF|nr:uncharacterized protein LOC121048564 [Ixodes scapularis]
MKLGPCLQVPGSGDQGDLPSDKRKRPLRFAGQHDIQLLQEVVNLNPFKDTPPTTAWASISRNLESVLAISSRRCRERTILMLDQFIKGDYPSLQRFCTKEEFAVKEQLLQQVLQQYESGAGGYSSRIGIVASGTAAPHDDNDDDDDFDLDKIRPRVILQEELTPEHSPSPESDSEHDRDEEASPVKRARTTEDDHLLETIRSTARMGNGAADFPTQVVTFLLSRQLRESALRDRELRIRREEVQLERAKLRLQEDKLSLEKARFEIERQERELRLRSEIQERAVFMEVLKKVFSNGLGGL